MAQALQEKIKKLLSIHRSINMANKLFKMLVLSGQINEDDYIEHDIEVDIKHWGSTIVTHITNQGVRPFRGYCRMDWYSDGLLGVQLKLRVIDYKNSDEWIAPIVFSFTITKEKWNELKS